MFKTFDTIITTKSKTKTHDFYRAIML